MPGKPVNGENAEKEVKVQEVSTGPCEESGAPSYLTGRFFSVSMRKPMGLNSGGSVL